jgi:hydrogenase nickel incorporation protein HypA/HybF
MHEFGIAQGLLETVLAKAEENRATRIDWIKLEIGVLSGVEEDALRFAFAALCEGTLAESAELKIAKIPLRCYCATCDAEFDCSPFEYHCPGCGEVSGEVRRGREMNLMAMEVT